MFDKECPLWIIVIVSMPCLIAFGFLIGINSHQYSEVAYNDMISASFTTVGAIATIVSIGVMCWIFIQWKSQRLNDYLFEAYLNQTADLKILKSYSSAHLSWKLLNHNSNEYLNLYTESLLRCQSKARVIRKLTEKSTSHEELTLNDSSQTFIDLCDVIGRVKYQNNSQGMHLISFGWDKNRRDILNVINNKTQFNDTKKDIHDPLRNILVTKNNCPYDFLYLTGNDQDLLSIEVAKIFADLIEDTFRQIEIDTDQLFNSDKFMPSQH
ncbi:hypothetical protein K6U58_00020 [Vibrio fluvialis]|uniref:hypothetical protein n=1 Tax=Vibrio fluvialis TaxID=676 RepID=UPI001C9C9D1C|nr:hypothetical protein [Vibrio fluvialis]MBY7960069.1 hypothetical protein [Vibrio fluvialis]MCG6356981.1 hypothetical protein [Vibrio fluvialis]